MAGKPPNRVRVTMAQWAAVMCLLLVTAVLIARVPLPAVATSFFVAAGLLLGSATWVAASSVRHVAPRSALALGAIGGYAGLGTIAGIPLVPIAALSCAGLAALVGIEWRRSALPEATRRFAQISPPAPVGATPAEPRPTEIDSDLERRLLARLGPISSDDVSLECEDEEDSDGVMSFAEAERDVTLRIERGWAPDVGEWIEGSFKVEFLAGQRVATVHLPLWPALKALPDVQCETLRGKQLQVKVAGRYRWGIRLELTRQATFSGVDVVEVAFFLRESNLRSEAA